MYRITPLMVKEIGVYAIRSQLPLVGVHSWDGKRRIWRNDLNK